ncbi:hypothetical protein HAX54_009145 [Datura stramonium]|uniref:Uncharacterized protein n=1 Tax=Datura stramonium TaxID=4076 RepID=A0ABS8TF69_DATST|nr:hypothetical protein [Datura stramonium]
MENNMRKRLTPTEMEEKRSKELYYFCDEKFLLVHSCKKKIHLFFIELDEEEEVIEEASGDVKEQEENLVENCEFSIHGVLFQDDFLVLPIGNCDLVQEMQRLCKLGNILKQDLTTIGSSSNSCEFHSIMLQNTPYS